MTKIPAYILCLLVVILPALVFAQESVVRCETFTGNPYTAEFSGGAESGLPTTVEGGSLRSAVKAKVEGYYEQCKNAATPVSGWKEGGSLQVIGLRTGNTPESVTAWIPSTIDVNSLQANASFQIYVTEGVSYRGQTYTVRKDGNTERFIKVSGPGYLDTCQSKQRRLNDFLAREQQGLEQGDEKYLTSEQRESSLIKQLSPELLALCHAENTKEKNPTYGQISTLMGRTEEDANAAVGAQMIITCEHLMELYGYQHGEMCIDGLAHQTFSTGTITLGAGGGGVATIIQRVMGIMAGTIGSVAMLVMVIGGFMMITAGGNEDMVTRGKQAFTYGIMGILIVFSSYLIVAFIQSLFFAIS